MEKITVFIVLVLALVGGWYFLKPSSETNTIPLVVNPKNTTYLIDEEPFTLVNGRAEKEVTPGSASKSVLSIFGEPAYGDIDNDGDDDAVVILTLDSGGSGTFYYAGIAVNDNGSYKGTDTILLGDRIAPQSYAIREGKAEVNYAIRNPGEDFSVQPSLGQTVRMQVDPSNNRLIQIAVDFEGEADPARMELGMNKWKWIQKIGADGEAIFPKQKDAFTISFKDDGTFSATTDCNSIGGSYTTNVSTLTFTDVATTLKYCEDSEEQIFSSILSDTETFTFTSKGELILSLKGKGTAVFR